MLNFKYVITGADTQYYKFVSVTDSSLRQTFCPSELTLQVTVLRYHLQTHVLMRLRRFRA